MFLATGSIASSSLNVSLLNGKKLSTRPICWAITQGCRAGRKHLDEGDLVARGLPTVQPAVHALGGPHALA